MSKPDIHEYLRRTYGPLPEVKVEKAKPTFTLKIEVDHEAVERAFNEILASWEEQMRRAIEEALRRRREEEEGL